MTTKQVKIFTDDEDQSIAIKSNCGRDGLIIDVTEEDDKKSFRLYVSIEEALCIGKELIKYAEELKSSNNV